MTFLVANGAMLRCDQGLATGTLIVMPRHTSSADMWLANIEDHDPLVNIQPFGMCRSLANPQVAAATASAMGVLTPVPCIPSTSSPWTGGSQNVFENVGAKEIAVLLSTSSCMCDWVGTITIIDPNCVHTHD